MPRVLVASLVAVVLAGGCTLVGGPEYYIEPNYYAVSAVGSGGSGSAANGSAANGSGGGSPTVASGTSAGSLSGGGFECDKSLCASAKNPSCGDVTCVAPNECALVLKKEGAPCANEAGKPYCASDGGCVECLVEGEKEHCPTLARPFCVDGACGQCRKNDDCTMAGAIVCDPKSHECVQCLEGDNGPCKAVFPEFVCVGTVCKVPTCKNKVVDEGFESDVDCGGSCSPCPTGKLCLDADDCVTGVCRASGAALRCACDVSSQCLATEYCDGTSCLSKKDGGAKCGNNDECKSSKCSTGISCWFSNCCQ